MQYSPFHFVLLICFKLSLASIITFPDEEKFIYTPAQRDTLRQRISHFLVKHPDDYRIGFLKEILPPEESILITDAKREKFQALDSNARLLIPPLADEFWFVVVEAVDRTPDVAQLPVIPQTQSKKIESVEKMLKECQELAVTCSERVLDYFQCIYFRNRMNTKFIEEKITISSDSPSTPSPPETPSTPEEISNSRNFEKKGYATEMLTVYAIKYWLEQASARNQSLSFKQEAESKLFVLFNHMAPDIRYMERIPNKGDALLMAHYEIMKQRIKSIIEENKANFKKVKFRPLKWKKRKGLKKMIEGFEALLNSYTQKGEEVAKVLIGSKRALEAQEKMRLIEKERERITKETAELGKTVLKTTPQKEKSGKDSSSTAIANKVDELDTALKRVLGDAGTLLETNTGAVKAQKEKANTETTNNLEKEAKKEWSTSSKVLFYVVLPGIVLILIVVSALLVAKGSKKSRQKGQNRPTLNAESGSSE